MIRATLTATAGLVLLMAGCDAKPPNASPAPRAGSLAPCATKAPIASQPSLPVPAPTAGATTGTAIMTIETNLGVVEIDIERSKVRCLGPQADYPEMLYGQGTVAMANTGRPGSTGSQFFFAYRDFKLPAAYTVLGQVRTGMDIIMRVAADGTVDGSTDGQPRTRLVISKVTVR